ARLGAVGGVEAHRHRPAAQDGKIAVNPLGAVLPDDRRPVTGLETQVQQAVGQVADRLPVLGPGDLPPETQALLPQGGLGPQPAGLGEEERGRAGSLRQRLTLPPGRVGPEGGLHGVHLPGERRLGRPESCYYSIDFNERNLWVSSQQQGMDGGAYVPAAVGVPAQAFQKGGRPCPYPMPSWDCSPTALRPGTICGPPSTCPPTSSGR